MSMVDYKATSTLWVLPSGNNLSSQPTSWHQIPLADAIKILLSLPEDEQRRASIETAGRSARIEIDEARLISRRPDFPRN